MNGESHLSSRGFISTGILLVIPEIFVIFLLPCLFLGDTCVFINLLGMPGQSRAVYSLASIFRSFLSALVVIPEIFVIFLLSCSFLWNAYLNKPVGNVRSVKGRVFHCLNIL